MGESKRLCQHSHQIHSAPQVIYSPQYNQKNFHFLYSLNFTVKQMILPGECYSKLSNSNYCHSIN